jgi:chromosome segregation ATPase
MKEKQDKEFALLEISQLNEKFVNLNKELSSQKSPCFGNTQANIANELENLERTKADYNNIRQELKASNHHRHILKETIEQLEKHLKSQVDVNSDLRFHLNRNNIGSIDDVEVNEEDTLRRHVIR